MDTTGLQARIEKLEELAAFHERTIDELSTQLAEQWKITDKLQKKLGSLTDRFLALEESSLEAPAITRPPHY